MIIFEEEVRAIRSKYEILLKKIGTFEKENNKLSDEV